MVKRLLQVRGQSARAQKGADTVSSWLHDWLADLPTVQFQAVISAILACGTALIYWVCVARQIVIDSVNFGIWLSFVAAYGGVTYYKAFKTKRQTYKPHIMSAQNGNLPMDSFLPDDGAATQTSEDEAAGSSRSTAPTGE